MAGEVGEMLFKVYKVSYMKDVSFGDLTYSMVTIVKSTVLCT